MLFYAVSNHLIPAFSFDTLRADIFSSMEDEKSIVDLLEGMNKKSQTMPTNCTPSPTPLRQKDINVRDAEAVLVFRHVAKYAISSWFSVFLSLSATLLAWSLTCLGFRAAYPYWFILCPLFGLVKMRVFVQFHDCGHNSFTPSLRANRVFGTFLGAILYSPFESWSFAHRVHHMQSNNWDYPQEFAQSSPWTLDMYRTATPKQQFWYKMLFGPRMHFTIIPFIAMVILQRFSSLWYENALSLLTLLTWIYMGGLRGLCFELIAAALVGIFGYMLFHIQHTFEGSYKATGDDWSFFENGMEGCSFFQVPRFLTFFTCGIEYHHIHHLNTRVPSYQLQLCHETAVVPLQELEALAQAKALSRSPAPAAVDPKDSAQNEKEENEKEEGNSTTTVSGLGLRARHGASEETGVDKSQQAEERENQKKTPQLHSLFGAVAHVSVRDFFKTLSFSLYDTVNHKYVSVYDY